MTAFGGYEGVRHIIGNQPMVSKENIAMADRMTTSDVMSGGGGSGRRGVISVSDTAEETPPAPVKAVVVQSNEHVVDMLKKVDELHSVALLLENSDELADVLYKAVMLKESVMHYDQMMKERMQAEVVSEDV